MSDLIDRQAAIDVDELSKQKYENIWTNRLVINADDLDDAPTVIEAEE